ncbi:MAG: isoprenylcysteine carboxylmethyltransferase family protein [Chloroflexi bacterium]|nr:MAG: isoprenylcysteine carboxylmethyltransferase family protein [Chloroflexota bacterium]MCQ3935644.1 isoprenylcysteine carboxylmethyltransferase family protein [Chloroflexota bacterium]MDL1940872.1 isoprenylcysteine carboxylmethyltransferase family protein [Chloroflexi bacterium CFX2]
MTDKQKDSPQVNKNIHPSFVALFYLVVTMILQRFAPIPFDVTAVGRYIGLGLTFVGFMLGVGAYLEFRKMRMTLDLYGSVRALVTSGVYRFTRNPIYLGFFLMVAGFPLNSGSLWGLVVAPFFAMTMSRLVIEKEEAYLEKKFKEEYTAYKSRVRRWL